MNDIDNSIQKTVAQHVDQPEYVAPVVRVMSEAEVLSAFQVNATGTTAMWWTC